MAVTKSSWAQILFSNKGFMMTQLFLLLWQYLLLDFLFLFIYFFASVSFKVNPHFQLEKKNVMS